MEIQTNLITCLTSSFLIFDSGIRFCFINNSEFDLEFSFEYFLLDVEIPRELMFSVLFGK